MAYIYASPTSPYTKRVEILAKTLDIAFNSVFNSYGTKITSNIHLSIYFLIKNYAATKRTRWSQSATICVADYYKIRPGLPVGLTMI